MASESASMNPAVTPDPVLVTLAAARPDLDPIRWRVTVADGAHEFIAGERIAHPDHGTLLFVLDDGTTRDFAPGEWTSLLAMPGKPAPTLDAIAYRLLAFGIIDNRTYLNRGRWLQAQPEWIDAERAVLTDDPAALAQAENLHHRAKMGL